jgi:hypothetical protein
MLSVSECAVYVYRRIAKENAKENIGTTSHHDNIKHNYVYSQLRLQ